ncbi:hypothetical protein [Paenibacillus sp. DMB5]|uniref:hypothetical protein n=1 Tax=Paenibacillus sp. DMB5 TaxID=1780103 RepID=UPI00076C96D1|nr:hypothetical protein [Paenibacillus sp. DMB5]KUP24863.1 hypothetical protein AWJ19_26620 [Paenibacillus sp. DMB5]
MNHSASKESENDGAVPTWQLASLPVMQRHTEAYIDEQLLPQQRIEAGGPPQRVSLSSFPAPIRYIGYAVVYGIPLIVLVLILISLFK